MSAPLHPSRPFRPQWRQAGSRAFDLERTSSAGRAVDVDFWGHVRPVYQNANFSVYSAQTCNARCAFCVEELRPASRGGALDAQKTVLSDDADYFAALNETLRTVAPLAPSISITGGEPSLDPRLPRILQTVRAHAARKLTVTTNASGLLRRSDDGRALIAHLGDAGVQHLNISRAHGDTDTNQRLMRFVKPEDAPTEAHLVEVVRQAKARGVRVRLSCVLIAGAVQSLSDIKAYVAFAKRCGVDNVIFRQLMKTDAATHADNFVVKYSDRVRVDLRPVFAALDADAAFTFVRQVMGYYYYVEVWRYGGVDVVFEGADLARLEAQKRADPLKVHELIFHPNATLCSTWQPHDGVLGPHRAARGATRLRVV